MSGYFNPTQPFGMGAPSMGPGTFSAGEENSDYQIDAPSTFAFTDNSAFGLDTFNGYTGLTAMNQPLQGLPYDHAMYDTSMVPGHANYTTYNPQSPHSGWANTNMVDAHHSAPFVYHLPATNVHASNPQMTINTNIPPYFPPFNDFSPSVGTPSSYTSSPTPVQSVRVSPAGLRASRARRADRERPGAFICEICFQDFTRRCNLDAHTRSHLGLKPYACTECTRQFGTKSVLNRHKRALHPDLA